jgi:signal transduction histidine kinase
VRRRIIGLLAAVVVLAVTALLVPTSSAIASRNQHAAKLELQREASVVASSMKPDRDLDMSNLALIVGDEEHSIAIYRSDGSLVGGKGPARADAATVVALGGGFGEERASGMMIAAVPIPRNGGETAALRVAESSSSPDRASQQQMLLLTGFAVLVILLTVTLGWIVANRVIRPLTRLREAANAIGSGAVDASIPHTGLAEVDDLARALTSSAKQVRSTMDRERRFSSDASHQLRTPLAAMRVVIESELAVPRADRDLALHEVLGAVGRLEQTVTGLLDLTRGTASDRGVLELSRVLNSAVTRWTPLFSRADRPLKLMVSGPVSGFASATAVEQILDVLIHNSLAHGRGTTRVKLFGDDVEAVVCVSDEGSIAGGDPFHARASGGHGIGLKLASTLAETERCRLSLASNSPVRFQLVLPKHPPSGGEHDSTEVTEDVLIERVSPGR